MERVDERAGARGRLLGRLQHRRVAGRERGGGHAARDREREVPGRDHGGHAARRVAHRVALARHLDERAALVELDRLERVVLEEVDRLAHVAVRLRPRLRALAHLQRRQLEPALAQDLPRRARSTSARSAAERAPQSRKPRSAASTAAAASASVALPARATSALRRARVGRVEAGCQPRSPPTSTGTCSGSRASSSAQRLQQRLARRCAAQLQDRLVAEAHGAASSSSIGVPRCCSPRNDSFAVFSSSRRTRYAMPATRSPTGQ